MSNWNRRSFWAFTNLNFWGLVANFVEFWSIQYLLFVDWFREFANNAMLSEFDYKIVITFVFFFSKKFHQEFHNYLSFNHWTYHATFDEPLIINYWAEKILTTMNKYKMPFFDLIFNYCLLLFFFLFFIFFIFFSSYGKYLQRKIFFL